MSLRLLKTSGKLFCKMSPSWVCLMLSHDETEVIFLTRISQKLYIFFIFSTQYYDVHDINVSLLIIFNFSHLNKVMSPKFICTKLLFFPL